MCNTCGCNITPANKYLLDTDHSNTSVEVLQNLMSENDRLATHNRQHFDEHNVLVINLMSSPGSGKTMLLESTIDALNKQYKIAVIEGDLETENDAERIRAKGVTAYQITTGSACHLDAHMIHNALHHLDLSNIDILFIENVGNLVCPASFDLGHHHNVCLLSVTEGDDKPIKYPVMFRKADLVLLTKTDLLPFLDDFNPDKPQEHLRQLANAAPVVQISAKNHAGMDHWYAWLSNEVNRHHKTDQSRLAMSSVRRAHEK